MRSREFSEKGEWVSGNWQISSNENEVIKTILSKRGFFCFFAKKILHAQKDSQTKINQQNKYKLTLNNKGNNFLRIQTSRREKVAYFTLAYSTL